MIHVHNYKLYELTESNCINCNRNQIEIIELKQAITGINAEYSYWYRIHEDDTFKIKELEPAQFKPSMETRTRSKLGLIRGKVD